MLQLTLTVRRSWVRTVAVLQLQLPFPAVLKEEDE
jgi:hypothetical protein